MYAQTPFNLSGCPRYICQIYPNFYKTKSPRSTPLGASKKNFAYFASEWAGDSHLTHYLTSKMMGF